MEWIFSVEGWVALVSLVSLEIVLGIDNIIFISVLVARLPEHQRQRARLIGLSLAMLSRLMLLAGLFWIMKLVVPLFSIAGHDISGRDLILIFGGLFLLAKATFEIHHSLENAIDTSGDTPVAASYAMILTQIAIVDMVFSLDSVITAVGMVDYISIMVLAVLASVGVMMFSAKAIGDFVDRNPTIKMLALSFLMLIGVTLIGEGLGLHVPKGYIYFAMAFSLSVELLNLRARNNAKTKKTKLQRYYLPPTEQSPTSGQALIKESVEPKQKPPTS